MTRFESLLNGYRNDMLSREELDEWLQLLEANNMAMESSVLSDLQQNAFAGLTTAAQRQRLFGNIIDRTRTQQKSRVVTLWRRVAVAAAVLILAGAAAWLVINRKPDRTTAKTTGAARVQPDILPGGDKAVLTLADGATIVLDSAANGKLTEQGKTTVIKSGDGQLVYDAKARPAAPSPRPYNMLSTPRGGQYQLVLPDGSKVWLNAASSIRFPVEFYEDKRRVEITGEAYFEVAPDKTKPFIVKFRGGGEVQVLGTHFNINAYDDEPSIKTTLLEGRVKVVNRQSAIGNENPRNYQEAILKPGEQVSLSHTSQLSQPIQVQTDEVMSWKNGRFYFSNSDIESIMRQMARWYDVEVEYKAHPEDRYTVSLSRNVPVSKLLNYLELSGGVHFKIEGKKIVVM